MLRRRSWQDTAPFAAVRVRPRLAMVVLALVLAASVLVAVSLGPVSVPPRHTVAILGHLDLGQAERDALVVRSIRLPRVLTAALVGAALAVAGAIMQALFRNPLAEPGVVGISSGAALGAVVALSTGIAAAGTWALPLAAFAGAMGTLALVYAVCLRHPEPTTLLLVGIALGALLSAVVSALVANADDEANLRGLIFWLQGDLDARTWDHVAMGALPVGVGVAVALAFGRDLNAMLLGEEQARATGVDTGVVRHTLMVTAALLTGAAVAVSGVLSFVGLVVPHMVRLVLGPDHRTLLPCCALLGAAFVVLADLGARMLLDPVVLRTGVVTALVGAPVFLALILRTRRSPR